jgi:hypothetical protein
MGNAACERGGDKLFFILGLKAAGIDLQFNVWAALGLLANLDSDRSGVDRHWPEIKSG